jgi:hypothetical protein
MKIFPVLPAFLAVFLGCSTTPPAPIPSLPDAGPDATTVDAAKPRLIGSDYPQTLDGAVVGPPNANTAFGVPTLPNAPSSGTTVLTDTTGTLSWAAGGGGGVDAGPDGDFYQTVAGVPTWVPISQDLTCASGGACTITQMQDGAVVSSVAGTLTGFFSAPTGYCIGRSSNSINWTAIGLGSSACVANSIADDHYALAWNGTNTLLNTPAFGETLIQSGGTGDTVASFSFGSNVEIGATDDFGGGTGVLSINKATTNPVCSSFAHGSGIYADSATGILFVCNEGSAAPVPVSSPVTWAGDLVGSTNTSQTVSGAQNNTIAFSNQGTMTCDSTATSCAWTQASTASSTAANSVWTPQQSTQGTNETGGNAVVNLQAPIGTGSEPSFVVERNGTYYGGIQAFPSFPSRANLYLGPGIVPSTSNQVIESDGVSLTYFNSPGSLGFILSGATFMMLIPNTSGIQFFASLQSFGGGTQVLGIANAGTIPTSNPSGGGVFYENAGTLSHRGPNGAITGFAGSGSSGAVNSQTQTFIQSWGTAETSSAATTLVDAVPTASGSGGALEIELVSRAVSAGCGAVGDTAIAHYYLGYKNVGGTVTLSVTGITLVGAVQTTNALVTSTMTATASGANVLLNVVNVATCTVDSQVTTNQYQN